MQIYPLEHELQKPYILRLNEISEPFPAHRHYFLEFSYIINGSGTEIINGREHKIREDSFTLLLPYQVHELKPDDNSTLLLYNCNLGMEAFFGLNRISEELNKMIFNFEEELPSFITFSGDKSEIVRTIFETMITEIHEKKIWNSLLFKTKLVELFILFDRARRSFIPNHPTNEIKRQVTKNNRDYLWKIIYYIHNHYMEVISLENLARRFGITSSHLSTTFKNYFGENIHSFLNEIRIKQACSLLVSSNRQITDIAIEVGFNSYATFSRVFRQKTGLSASEYKQQIVN